MADICDYKIIVKGKKNACYAFYGATPAYNVKEIIKESGTEDKYTLQFSGDCKWMIDSYCEPWSGPFPVEIPEDFNEAMNKGEFEYCDILMQDRSKVFNVEVYCISINTDYINMGGEDFDDEDYDDEDVDYDFAEEYYEEEFPPEYVHYKNGERIQDECPKDLNFNNLF